MSNEFLGKVKTVFNSGQSRSVLVTGNVNDLFYSGEEKNYVPLLGCFLNDWNSKGNNDSFIKITYAINEGVVIVGDELGELDEAWKTFHAESVGIYGDAKKFFGNETLAEKSSGISAYLKKSKGSSTFSLELLRQLCLLSRTKVNGSPLLDKNLLIIVEGLDMLIPQSEISRLSDSDRKRVAICKDWLSDPDFMNGKDSVVFLSESRNTIHSEVSRLPQFLEVNVGSPDFNERRRFIEWFLEGHKKLKFWGKIEDVAVSTAGLSIHALRQLLMGASYSGKALGEDDVTGKVEEFLISQLGEGVIQFYRPTHTFEDIVGNTLVKDYFKNVLLPRIKKGGDGSISGLIVGGPIGSGKTYVCGALASSLGMPVIVLKNLRSKWFGETDVILERLERVFDVLSKALIFVDEADTQFGGLGKDVHATEKRLTGKIQAMMSDTKYRGKIIWLLMTARIELLSPDLRRKGRCGDLIIPILDPTADDLKAFVRWTVRPVMEMEKDCTPFDIYQIMDEEKIAKLFKGYSAAAFASMRSELVACAGVDRMNVKEIEAVVKNSIYRPNKIRRIQELEALLNCTHMCLIPKEVLGEDPEEAFDNWEDELVKLKREALIN